MFIRFVLMLIFGLTQFSFGSSVMAKGSNSVRSFNLTLPLLAFARESIIRGEYNLAGQGSLALEGTFITKGEDLLKSEITETNGDSLKNGGREFAVFYTKYSNPALMDGFFWGIGVGYRWMQADWLTAPDESVKLDPNLVSQTGKANYTLQTEGVTGHGRIGYRYVGESVPLLAGIYIGVRHYELNPPKSTITLSDADQIQFQRRFRTRLEPGIEFGLSF